jgi:hypothetical protein
MSFPRTASVFPGWCRPYGRGRRSVHHVPSAQSRALCGAWSEEWVEPSAVSPKCPKCVKALDGNKP